MTKGNRDTVNRQIPGWKETPAFSKDIIELHLRNTRNARELTRRCESPITRRYRLGVMNHCWEKSGMVTRTQADAQPR